MHNLFLQSKLHNNHPHWLKKKRLKIAKNWFEPSIFESYSKFLLLDAWNASGYLLNEIRSYIQLYPISKWVYFHTFVAQAVARVVLG